MKHVLSARAAVLLALRSGPGHGLALLREVRDVAGFAPQHSAVYKALRDLEADGLAAAEPAEGWWSTAARTYRLTPEGRRTADEVAAALRRLCEDRAPRADGAPARRAS